MTARPENTPPSWLALAESLGGSFTARARGLLNPELVLIDHDGRPFGALAPHGDAGATLLAGDVEAKIERSSPSLYEMTSEDSRLLTAETGGRPTTPEVRSEERTYETRISLLRNRATARNPEGLTIARISGGLSNRRYEATFDPEDRAALPVALFLLYRLYSLRSRAYQTR